MVPPASIFVSFNHRGHKFIKNIELANFSGKYFSLFLKNYDYDIPSSPLLLKIMIIAITTRAKV